MRTRTTGNLVRWWGLGLAGLAIAVAPGTARGEQPAASSVEVGPSMEALLEADWIDRDRRFNPASETRSASDQVNEYGVTTAQDAAGGVDGVKNGRWGFHVASGQIDAWWQVDLGAEYRLDRVVIFNRTARSSRTAQIRVAVAADEAAAKAGSFEVVYQHDGTTFHGVADGGPLVVDLKEKNVTARVVRLSVPGACSFALDEVEVYAADDPQTNVALKKPADQKSVSVYSYPGTLPDGVQQAAPPASTPSGGGFTLAHTRQVVDRAGQLAARLGPTAPVERLAPLAAELDKLNARLVALEAETDAAENVRAEIYFDARRLARQIAFTNPLLDMDKILFVKRHDSTGVFHMCDQYYGCNAVPGGGLFVLDQPFGPNPTVTDLLADADVENGRLAGQSLAGGSFLAPELSYDGREILFAHTQAKGYAKFQGKEAYEWGPELSYHLFKVNSDGTELTQLTDGDTDDFDPCYLPNGRIVFVTERRGGYLRCGRHCPVYTMFSMEPDGSDIVCISFHETHEWHPSVNNEGMIVYSRWDYVDRDTNVAHHIWTCFPDGRDPRSFHGNYPAKREGRPWMEMSSRAIPGSNQYVFSTGAHHGHAFGSLLLLDPRIEDDNAMSQLTRLTPDVLFPESAGGKAPIKSLMKYGTPWPLSEQDFLCVYGADAKNRGIYWIDSRGNRELLYRDPAISCISPIPLRPRPRPPVIPSATMQAARDRTTPEQALAPGIVSVANVYDADFEWPENTRIDALRVIQVLPKSTAPPNVPRIGVANQTNARAVLGTVPVESDGSALFEVPSGKEIYFQALDSRGRAVQSMRSGTYLHPGERLQCQGCHERKHDPPSLPAQTPLAMRRPPSKLTPDVDGSRPFNYVRLVQPALDRNCVECHQSEKALDLSGTPGAANGWTRSYANLAGEYGFYFHVSNGSINTGIHGGVRTTAGKFGARASRLMDYMDSSHHGVELSDEDFHRLTLWLDCNSEFYGSYEDTEAQGKGQIVLPILE